jgi:hypothetical protein
VAVNPRHRAHKSAIARRHNDALMRDCCARVRNVGSCTREHSVFDLPDEKPATKMGCVLLVAFLPGSMAVAHGIDQVLQKIFGNSAG